MPTNKPLVEAFDRRFLFFTGKGGAGKTLVSATAATWSARQGHRTLWVEMTEHPAGSRLFTDYQPDYEPKPLADNLWGMNLKVQPAIEEYLALVFPIPFLSRLIARNSLFQAITAALPGIDSLIPLGKLWYELGRQQDGKPVWDRIVLDAPATGHALAMLRLPGTVLGLVETGNLAERTREIDQVIGNTGLTRLFVVTTAEELPIEETVAIVNEIDQQTNYRIDGVICNALCPDIGQGKAELFRQWLEDKPSAVSNHHAADRDAAFRYHLSRLESRRRQQLQLLPRLERLQVNLHDCPWMPGIADRQRLMRLSRVVEEQ